MSTHPSLLVVDDEAVICQACDRVFSRQGFQVHQSSDAREGLGWAAERDYAGILLDIKMPEMDGLEFLAQLRKTKPDIPVVIMTGYPSIPNAAEAVRLGASDYVTKPFTPEQITQSVQRVLAGRLAVMEEEAPAAAPAEETREQGDRFLFFGPAWLQPEEDGSARVGAVVAPNQAAEARSIVLPKVGEVVYQGLPLAGITLSDGTEVIVPAPVSGLVVAVNERLNDEPTLLATDPCGEGWIACVCTTRYEDELDQCQPCHLATSDAAEPLSGAAVVAILEAAFATEEKPRAPRPAFSEPLRGLRITNHNGHKVHLMAAPGLLRSGTGLGAEILRHLRAEAFPITTMPGEAEITPAEVVKAASVCDHLMVLAAKDTGRLPGSLSRDTKAEYVSACKESVRGVTTLVMQPGPEATLLGGLDAPTTAALARHVVEEMAAF
jgi:CheY-like chemotaxis protein/glycine cleavage system H lipoate-binding protein